MQKHRYISLGLTIIVSLFCICPTAFAQSRADKIRKRYSHLLEKVEHSYYNYNFEKADKDLQNYATQLRRRGIKADEDCKLWESKIKNAKHALTYAQKVQLVDSLIFPQKDIKSVFEERSSFLANHLSFELDSTSFYVNYHSPLASQTYYTERDSSYSKLYTADTLLDGRVSKISLSETVNEPNNQVFNPFLLNTGLTLVFARQSDKGLGKTDLYYARYNTDTKSFYKARSLGMPFNSLFNDYLLAYDDEQGLSYLVSDRFCPKDSLVLYRFKRLPNEIADTEKLSHDNALDSLESNGLFLRELDKSFFIPKLKRVRQHSIHLPLKDGVVISSWEGFRSPEALSHYRDVLALEEQLRDKRKYQIELRQRYRNGKKDLEVELEALPREIKSLELKIKDSLKACKNLELRYREF